MTEKLCSRCKSARPASEFSRAGPNSRTKDGLSTHCKECVAVYSRAWAKRNKARLTWRNMRSRCENPKDISFENYGGRGIKVCQEWQTFSAFKVWFDATFVPGLVLDRADNDGDYSTENCRWATLSVQNKNKRVTPKQLAHIRAAQKISADRRRGISCG